MNNPRICVLDTETTGLHPGREVWEFGALTIEPDGTKEEHHLYIQVNLAEADPFGLKVGGFYDRHPEGRHLSGKPRLEAGEYRTPSGAAHRIAEVTHGAVIVGSNPSFDTVGLDALLRTNGLVPAWHYRPIDVVDRAVGFLAGIGFQLPPTTRTDDVAQILGIDIAEDLRHTALGDAHLALGILEALDVQQVTGALVTRAREHVENNVTRGVRQ